MTVLVPRRPWTKADDELLVRLKDEYTLPGGKTDWDQLATHFKGRSGPACREHLRWLQGESIPSI